MIGKAIKVKPLEGELSQYSGWGGVVVDAHFTNAQGWHLLVEGRSRLHQHLKVRQNQYGWRAVWLIS